MPDWLSLVSTYYLPACLYFYPFIRMPAPSAPFFSYLSLSRTNHHLLTPSLLLPHLAASAHHHSPYLAPPIAWPALASPPHSHLNWLSHLCSFSPDAGSGSETSSIPLPPQSMPDLLSSSSRLFFARLIQLSCWNLTWYQCLFANLYPWPIIF